MSPLLFYREQAAPQQAAADNATLQNVRERCRRASDAWTVLALRTECGDSARLQAVTDKLLNRISENPDQGAAAIQAVGGDV